MAGSHDSVVFVYGLSAIAFWLTSPVGPEAFPQRGLEYAKRYSLGRSKLDDAKTLFPQAPSPFVVWAPFGASGKVRGALVRHGAIPRGMNCFSVVSNSVCVANPAYAFIDACRMVQFHERVKLGSALISPFRVDPASPGGVASRAPIATKADLLQVAQECARMHGAPSAQEALRFIEGAASSPPEIFMRMVLCLPMARGGLGIGGLVANYPIEQSERGRAISGRRVLIPDLFHAAARVAVEYDSDSMHLNSRQTARDNSKRLALEAMGVKVITLSTTQLRDKLYMQHVGEEIAAIAGHGLRIRAKSFSLQRDQLFSSGYSIASFINRDWINMHLAERAQSVG